MSHWGGSVLRIAPVMSFDWVFILDLQRLHIEPISTTSEAADVDATRRALMAIVIPAVMPHQPRTAFKARPPPRTWASCAGCLGTVKYHFLDHRFEPPSALVGCNVIADGEGFIRKRVKPVVLLPNADISNEHGTSSS